MSAFNLADTYRAAKISLQPEHMRLRQTAFDGALKNLDKEKYLHLVRLYFGMPDGGETEWFRLAFAETDPSFSMIDNAREAAVLAAGLLHKSVQDGQAFAGICALAAYAGGGRNPLVLPETVRLIEREIDKIAISNRARVVVKDDDLKSPAMGKLPADALSNIPGFPQLGPVLQQIGDLASAADGQLVKQLRPLISSVVAELTQLREEVDILWWLTGGSSRHLNRPFSVLELSVTPILAGIDLADLSRTYEGPVACRSILLKALQSTGKTPPARITIAQATEAMPPNAYKELQIKTEGTRVTDICPLFTAMAKAEESGGGAAWHESFKRMTGVDVSQSFSPIDLGMQAMWERTITEALCR